MVWDWPSSLIGKLLVYFLVLLWWTNEKYGQLKLYKIKAVFRHVLNSNWDNLVSVQRWSIVIGIELFILVGKRSNGVLPCFIDRFSNFAIERVKGRIESSPLISSSSSPYFRKYSNSWSPPSSGIEYQQTRQVTGRPATQINDNWSTHSLSLNSNPISCRMLTRINKS